MLRQTLSTAVIVTALTSCAANRAATANVNPELGPQMRATYTCVVDAIAREGYPVAAEEGKTQVMGRIRQELAPSDPALQDPRTGSGTGKSSDAGTPYSIDGVRADITVSERTGRIVVVTEGYTGYGLTRNSGYVQRPASARGSLAMKNARACAASQTSSE